jgi:hypothetical protein
MSKVKVALAVCLILASTVGSFASTTGSYFQQKPMRMAGSAGAGPSAINGIPQIRDATRSDPSGIGNASRMVSPPPPSMSVPPVPTFH